MSPTVEVDFVDPAYASGTGTSRVVRPPTPESLQCVRTLADTNFVGFDVAELLPVYDNPGQITALAATTIAFEMLSLVALARKRRGLTAGGGSAGLHSHFHGGCLKSIADFLSVEVDLAFDPPPTSLASTTSSNAVVTGPKTT